MAQYRCHIATDAGHCRAQIAALQTRPAVILLLSVALSIAFLLAPSSRLTAQESPLPAAQLSANPVNVSATGAPIQITLAEAEQRARKIEPTLQAALAARGTAGYNHSIARSALLPQETIIGEYLFTQSNGTNLGGTEPNSSGPVFIANNAVHEYISQGQATETLSLANVERYRQTGALARQAKAQAEIALRGLHVVVTQAYYTVESAARKLQAAQEAQQSAQNFLDLTNKLEGAREVAHADVLKAQLQLEQAQRSVSDAELAAADARQSLGVLLFRDPATPYVLADPLDANPGTGSNIEVPAEDEVRTLAAKSNPDLRSALEALKAADADVTASRTGYLPLLTLAYNYGLDAPRFEEKGLQGQQFLGYSASAGINIPVWDWFATHDRIKQSELLRAQSRTALDYTQRQLIAQLNASYGELKTATANLASLQTSAQEAKDSLHLAVLQYQAGQAIALEVVNAESAEVAARSALADGALRYQVARASLERLTGTLP